MQSFKKIYRVLNGKEFMINGVGGWVLVFSLTLLIIQPFIVIVSIIFSDINPQFFSKIFIVITMENILAILLMAFGIYSALLLLKKKKNAVSTTKIFLIAIVIHKIASILLIYSNGMLDSPMTGKAIVEIFLAAVYSLIWYIYFGKSKRVKITYTIEY